MNLVKAILVLMKSASVIFFMLRLQSVFSEHGNLIIP